jgi:hypothetical protein
MFGLFKRKSPIDKLREKRDKLLKESFDLSKIDRTKSDAKRAEAEEVEKEIEALKAKG